MTNEKSTVGKVLAIESALDWAILGMLSTLAVLIYLSLRLSTVYFGRSIKGASVYWFTAGLIGFVIIPLILAILIYLTWIRPMYKKQRPGRVWQLALITLGTVLYIVPGLILIIARRKLKHLPLKTEDESLE
jgi:predicted membrane protein